MAEVIFNVKAQIGKVYAYNPSRGRKCVGDGYKCLCKFIYDVNKGKLPYSEIEARIEASAESLAPDTELQSVDVLVKIDTETYDAIEVAELPNHVYVLTRPHLPEVMECVPLVEAPEPPVPPYRSKLHAYNKRRNYSKKSYWNRIRSRLF
jgi:hypothetical protein